LAIEKNFPKLSSGLKKHAEFDEYKKQIDTVLKPFFPSLLTLNEIKFATIPFQNIAIKCTQRYRNLIKAAGEEVSLEIINFDADQFYIMGCSIILNTYYGVKVDFRRSYYYNIPDEDGMVKN